MIATVASSTGICAPGARFAARSMRLAVVVVGGAAVAVTLGALAADPSARPAPMRVTPPASGPTAPTPGNRFGLGTTSHGTHSPPGVVCIPPPEAGPLP